MTRSTAPPVTGTVVPVPVSQVAGSGSFVLGPASAIAATGLAVPVAEYLVEALRPVTGSPLPIGDSGDIVLAIEAGHPPEGYALRVAADGIRITADAGAGLFWGVQTLRQLLPPATSAPIPTTSS